MRLRLTKRGRDTLRATDGAPLEDILTTEVMARIGEVEEQNLSDLLDTLVERHGSVENAIVAVKSGKVRFELVRLDEAPETLQ